MARPERRDADYFPFYAKRGRTLNILQSKFGLEGIGFFTNLMRFLTLTPEHHYCIKDDVDKMNFFSEMGIQDEVRGIEIIELMVKTGKIDKELWDGFRVIVSQDLLNSLEDAYKQRINKIITVIEIKARFVSMYGNPQSSNGNPSKENGNPATDEFPSDFDGHNPQRKGKERKGKKNKYTEASPPEVSDTSSSQKSEKTKKLPLREREPVNDMERVEKAYLANWDNLYAQGKVKALNPVINWNQTRKLLKNYFENFDPELIIQAVNNGLNDEWVMNTGYSLGTMLSASVLNRLINTNDSAPRHRIAADNVSKDKITSYFREAK